MDPEGILSLHDRHAHCRIHRLTQVAVQGRRLHGDTAVEGL